MDKTKKQERKTEKAETKDRTLTSINFSNTFVFKFDFKELIILKKDLKSVLFIFRLQPCNKSATTVVVLKPTCAQTALPKRSYFLAR